MGKPLFSKLHSIENDLKRIKITSNFVITFNHEEFCREYGIPITEEYPEENEKKRAFYDAGMEYTRYCKAIELQRIKDSFGK